MTLSQFLSETKRAILSDLEHARELSVGVHIVIEGGSEIGHRDLETVKRAKRIQVGTTVLAPESIDFEFLLLGDESQSLFVVRVPAPERIVYLPVPSWVIESVWQGEVLGSHHFESEADRLIAEFKLKTAPAENARLFHERRAIGRS